MKLVPLILASFALGGVAHAADIQVVSLPAAQDVSLPFMCSWGYDWEERCYRDDFDRLEVGGVDDKVWRSALRFSLGSIPAGATVVTAELWLRYDRTCVAPRRRTVACSGAPFDLEARPIYTSRWESEREVAFGPAVSWTGLEPGADPQWLVLDVTDLVGDWHSGGLANNGLLVKLVDDEEAYGAGGPAFPSSSFPDRTVRPRLEVWFMQ
jgi:TGF-beta propeptide